MSFQTLSLKQWFYRNARIPLLVALVAFIGVEAILLSVIGKNQFVNQKGVAERLAELSRVALEEKSTTLLQTAFDIARRELRASNAFVCEQSLNYVTLPPRLSACPVKEKWNERVIEVPISLPNRLRTPPFQQHKFVLQVPIFPGDDLIYYTLGVSFLVCCLGVGLLRRVIQRLERDLFGPLFRNLSNDLKIPIRELEELRQKLVQLGELKTQEAVTAAVMARNQQVAHDIKSPLTALLFASKDFDRLPESSRGVIQRAVERINSIADSLTTSPHETNGGSGNEAKDLGEILEELVEEKKFEHANQKSITWLVELEPSAKKLKSPLAENEMKRLLSNLINNSVEALEGRLGVIQLRAKNKSEGNVLQIEVEDNGKGMGLDTLKQVGKKGFSAGKTRGKGLGVSFAKSLLEQNGGNLFIHSQINQGTKVELCFPTTH